ncbi:MAG: DUF350 domain-containing protein [Polyangiaceae bacterium]
MERGSLYSFAFLATATLVILGLYQLTQRLVFSETSLPAELKKGNSARALLHAGHVLGLFIVIPHAVSGALEGKDPMKDAMWVAIFSLAGALLLAVTGALGVRALLRAKLAAEIARGNVAAGVAAASHYVATALLISSVLGGSTLRELGLAAAFFGLSQVTLHVFVVMFRALTSYDDDEEIMGENLAAALSYGGMTIGLALIIGRAVEGDFMGWITSLRGYGSALVYCLILFPIRQLVVQGVLLGAAPTLRGGALCDAIRSRNVAVGAIEAVTYLGTGLLLSHL